MNFLLSLALVSLVTPFRLQTDLVLIRPFGIFVALFVLLSVFRTNLTITRDSARSLAILAPFFLWHVISAWTVGFENGLRESLQMATIAAFAVAIISVQPRLNFVRVGQYLLFGFIIVTIVNIWWHVDQGFYFGWKRLLDPKRALTFLPAAIGCTIILASRERKYLYWLLWAMLGAVVVLSGERKALFVYLLLTAILGARGRAVPVAIIFSVVFLVVASLISVIDNPYLKRQLSSIVTPIHSTIPVWAAVQGRVPESFSNTQRLFALHTSWEIFSNSPVVGAGTNAYVDIIEERYRYLPRYLQPAPHGEMLRVMAENGLVGLLCYVFVWVSSFVRLRRRLSRLTQSGIVSLTQRSLLLATLSVPALAYVMFEASGTHSLVILLLYALLPGILEQALLQLHYKRQSLGDRARGPTGAVAVDAFPTMRTSP